MTNDAPMQIVFMLEEESAKNLLLGLLPEIAPGICCRFLTHQGKSDLQKSIPRKLRAWKRPNSFFVVLHDLDSNPDCIALKNELCELCEQAGNHGHRPLIRIVCKELEAWYLGDLDAVKGAFPKFNVAQYRNKSQYRCPDAITNPSKELEKIVPGFSKGLAAREVPQYMDIERNRSASFKNTITGIRKLVASSMNARNP